MKILKRCFVILALVILIAPARSQGQAGQVAEIQKRLDQARAEEEAAQAGLSKGESKFSDFEAASKKRAALEAELAKAKAPPVTAPAGPVAEIQKRLDQAKAEEAAAQAGLSKGELKFSDFEAASKKRAALEAELAKAKALPVTPPAGPVAEIQKRLDQARAEEDAASKKRALLEAELAKAKGTPVPAPAGPVAEIQKRLDQAKAEEAAAQANFSNGELKFSDFEAASKKRAALEAELAKAKATASPKADDEVIVPSIPAGLTVTEAKATLSAAGLAAGFNAKGGKPDSSDLEFKTTGAQDPPAGSKRKRGATVTVSIYQKYEPKTSPTPTPTPTPTPSPSATAALGTMPDLTGLTLEQAVTRLPAKMEILSDEVGDKPSKPELAWTIFFQTPAPGPFDPKKPRPTVVRVKRYGPAQSTVGTAERFDGTYTGSYSGSDSGKVRFSVSGGTIAITSPGSGTGQISASGSASISGSGADGDSSYTFSGTFSLDAAGKASAGGRWTGQQQGFKGHGNWGATRQ
jgi:hypothetical protein